MMPGHEDREDLETHPDLREHVVAAMMPGHEDREDSSMTFGRLTSSIAAVRERCGA